MEGRSRGKDEEEKGEGIGEGREAEENKRDERGTTTSFKGTALFSRSNQLPLYEHSFLK